MNVVLFFFIFVPQVMPAKMETLAGAGGEEEGVHRETGEEEEEQRAEEEHRVKGVIKLRGGRQMERLEG